MPKSSKASLYSALIARIFKNHYTAGDRQFKFDRQEVGEVADVLGVSLPKNVGDVIYSFRHRRPLPSSITATAPAGMEWVIRGAGRGAYRFTLVGQSRVVPRGDLVTIKIPDATPQIISAYALGDEQALLAKVRYNRLIDIFLGLTTYSLQNHLRTSVKGIGQIEIDEVYVGVSRRGAQFIIPVQAKGGSDSIGVVQIEQDVACCEEKFPELVCRPVATQFMSEDRIAMFELILEDEEVKVAEEKHYLPVPKDEISSDDLRTYREDYLSR